MSEIMQKTITDQNILQKMRNAKFLPDVPVTSAVVNISENGGASMIIYCRDFRSEELEQLVKGSQ